ncbi:hypothetical protein B0H12DRAFT_1150339 [Mycena haematopus]|nr:hypothetical protein B0H12DRAFT_1150339 [Mycena haematopus]
MRWIISGRDVMVCPGLPVCGTICLSVCGGLPQKPRVCLCLVQTGGSLWVWMMKSCAACYVAKGHPIKGIERWKVWRDIVANGEPPGPADPIITLLFLCNMDSVLSSHGFLNAMNLNIHVGFRTDQY